MTTGSPAEVRAYIKAAEATLETEHNEPLTLAASNKTTYDPPTGVASVTGVSPGAVSLYDNVMTL